MMKELPHRQELMIAVLQAIADLGGSASVDEIREKVISNLKIPDELANIPRVSKRGVTDTRTELEYQLGWCRTNLKGLSFLDNSERGVWTLTEKDASQLVSINISSISKDIYLQEHSDWKGEIIKTILKTLDPAGFERLIQRILRETGFVQVEVTGRTGDGGIDGKGIAKINGILSFYIVFQAKRYQGAVAASQIRDFRGAMIGRADKGLFITTGYFTRDAIKESTREGAPTIDLVDGEKLAEKLKSLNLGVDIEMIEKVTVDNEWFKSI